MLITLGALWLDALPLLSAVLTTAGDVAHTCTELLGACLTCACESGRCTGPVSTAAGGAAAAAAAGGLAAGGSDDGAGDTSSDTTPAGDDALPPGNEDVEC